MEILKLQERIRPVCTAGEIVEIFNRTFASSESTLLAFGGQEPVYYPAGSAENPGRYHRICFAHGFVNSALHETAHWCIAGKSRRLLTDYGYWYAPDGRTGRQQVLFEKVEVKPQALEWHLAKACGVKFHLSIDNLNALDGGAASSRTDLFRRAVSEQAQSYLGTGVPERAGLLKQVFADYFGTAPASWANADFKADDL